MGNVHQLILRHGVEQARQMADTKAGRKAVEVAAQIMSEEDGRLGITHAGFALTSLPHRKPAEKVWRREGHRTTLLIESGLTRDGQPLGVPYGSIARLILLYLQSEAIRTGSPEVELGRSMNSWLAKMDLAVGGRTYSLVNEQAKRISACRLTFFTDRENGAEQRDNGSFVRGAISLSGIAAENQASLWQDRVRLDEGFWRSLQEHPVPVREEAIRAIGTRSLAIDVYVWLAYRLHSLSKATPISWLSIHGQFGAGFKSLRHLKPTFAEALQFALAVYPEARVNVEKDGLVLHPSPPAVPKQTAKRLGLG
jgi:hypothetical protein